MLEKINYSFVKIMHKWCSNIILFVYLHWMKIPKYVGIIIRNKSEFSHLIFLLGENVKTWWYMTWK